MSRSSSSSSASTNSDLEVLGRAAHVADVEEGGLLHADVDERRLHARQHALDPALVDVADDAALALALDVELDELPLLDERDAGLRARRR